MLLAAAAINLVSESQDYVEISFELPEYEVETVMRDGKEWKRLSCDEAQKHSLEGYPELLVFSAAIGVPLDGDYSISITNSLNEIVSDIDIVPSATLILEGDEPNYSYTPNYKAYNNRELYPLGLAERGEPAFVGNRRFIPLMIYPFQYRAGSRELVVSKKFTITLTLGGSKASTKNWQLASNILDAAKPSFFLNDNSSKTWRLEKQRNADYQAPKNGLGSVNEIQIIVDKEGIYKVGYQYLMDYISVVVDSLQISMNWTPASVDPRYLELSDEYGQVPIHFVGESDGSFDTNDYFEFYGDAHKGDVSQWTILPLKTYIRLS
jgi:hypothetical protein